MADADNWIPIMADTNNWIPIMADTDNGSNVYDYKNFTIKLFVLLL